MHLQTYEGISFALGLWYIFALKAQMSQTAHIVLRWGFLLLLFLLLFFGGDHFSFLTFLNFHFLLLIFFNTRVANFMPFHCYAVLSLV